MATQQTLTPEALDFLRCWRQMTPENQRWFSEWTERYAGAERNMQTTAPLIREVRERLQRQGKPIPPELRAVRSM